MIGDVNLLGTLDLEVASPTDYDILKVIGSLTFGVGAKIDLILETLLAPGDYTFDFLQVDGLLSGFDPSMITIIGGNGGLGTEWIESCANGHCGLQLLLTQAATVPEPASLLLLLPAAGLVGALRRGTPRVNLRRRRWGGLSS